jgi:hypothetical protein
MSTGGKFILESLLNPNAQENILINMARLRKTIDERCPEKPFFSELYTHCSYIKKMYKPMIPMAFEYNSIPSDNGDLQFGSESRFLLIQYGDFQSEMILEINLGAVQCVLPTDTCAYVDFLGHRIMEAVRMEFAGNKVDEYSYDAYNVYYNFMVPEDKRDVWLDMVGQERPKIVLAPIGDAQARQAIYMVNGPQTPRNAQPALTLYIPIIFQFSRNLSSALFSGKIPVGQRYLYVKLPRVQDILYGTGLFNTPAITGRLWVNQVFIDPNIKKIILPGPYRNFIRFYKEQRIAVNVSGVEKLETIRYPTEHLFVGIRPAANVGSPTNWWRFHNAAVIPMTFPGFLPPNQLVFNTAAAVDPDPNILTMRFLSKNTEITREAGTGIYTKVFPFQKARSGDPGLMFFSFSAELGDKLAGYYNLNAMREFYIDFTAKNSGELYVMAICLNWLEIDDRGAVSLKFK